MDAPELKTDPGTLRSFALQVGPTIAVLFGLVFPWLLDVAWPLWPWVVGGTLAAWGLVAPKTLKPIYLGWMKFGLVLHRFVSPIVLGIVFFVVITPVAFGMRLAGRDQMGRRFEKDATTYRRPSKTRERSSMERPF